MKTCECPTCWDLQIDSQTCLPSSDKISVTCSSSGMVTEMDACIFAGENEIVTLSLIDETCISENQNGNLVISNALDECNTTAIQVKV